MVIISMIFVIIIIIIKIVIIIIIIMYQYYDYCYYHNYYYYHNCVMRDLEEDDEVHGELEGTPCRTQPGKDFSQFFCQGGLHKVIVLGKIIFYLLTPDISPRQPRRKPPRTRLRTPRGQQGGISRFKMVWPHSV